MLRFVLHIILTISILTWVNYRYNRRTVPVTDDVTNAKSVINAILMDTVSVICNQLYWIYMTNALSVSEYWKEEVCV